MDTQEKYRELIKECSVIVNHHKDDNSISTDDYNIYSLLHVTQNEVQMCRILADLLDPYGKHGAGNKYLYSFMRSVLKLEIVDESLQDARVYKEYPITNDRRIDIVITYHGGFVPIEVKINAGDQKSQCYDYYQYAKRRTSTPFIVYLTKDGYAPSDYSITGADGKKLPADVIKRISFRNSILEWLVEIKECSTEKMKMMIDQYAGAINDFVNSESEEYKMKLTNEMVSSSDDLRTSIEIASSINHAKGELIKRMFEEFEKQMEPLIDKYGLGTESRSGWFHYKYEATEQFYARNESTYPGVNYIVKSVDLGDELSLWLRIEVDNRLFGCLCVFDYAAKSETRYEVGNQCDKISDDLWQKLRQSVDLPDKHESDNWMVVWKYLPTGSASTTDAIDTVPDFKKMNEAAIALADEDKRVKFVGKCVKAIEDTLLALVRGIRNVRNWQQENAQYLNTGDPAAILGRGSCLDTAGNHQVTRQELWDAV